MNKDIWHTELNDFEKEQIFYCVFFTKKDPLLMRIGYYHPVKIKFGDYVNEYTPDKIKKFIKIDDLLDLETKLDRTRKALDVAVDALKEQQRWFGVIRVSLISHLNNQYGTLFKSYDADPTVVNIKRANDILNRALEQITAEQKDK